MQKKVIRKKYQILFIHGGMTFKNRKDYLNYLKTKPIYLEDRKYWIHDVANKLTDFQVIVPRMPQQDNAKYEDWSIYFERFIPELRNGVILIGSSLGGIFLAKYLSENKFPKKIRSVYLVCPPYDNTLSEEDLVGGFTLKSDLSLIEKNAKQITLMFSKNDTIVHISHAEKYQKKLKNARIIIYDDKNGHFKISEFPEIIKFLKEDVKRK
jgi:predicted alpha/beta hydrolase family esterase